MRRKDQHFWQSDLMTSTRATLAKERSAVAGMFDGVARRYDLMNSILSLNADRTWRRAVVDALDPQPGDRVLDLAAGTGTSSQPFADAGAEVFPTDLSSGMLAVGKQRLPHLMFTAGDAMALPYADDAFDKVTISFGLRNIADTVGALRELRRVTRPGGMLVVCEFSTPVWGPFRRVYEEYLLKALPAVARLSSNPTAYRYLAESIMAWPDQEGLASKISHAGWVAPGWRNLSGGIVALHRAWAPREGGDG